MGEMGEGGQEVQSFSCKTNQAWGCNAEKRTTRDAMYNVTIVKVAV